MIRKTIPVLIASNNVNYLGVTLAKQVKDLYDQNFKSLRKVKKISENGKIAHAHGLVGRF